MPDPGREKVGSGFKGLAPRKSRVCHIPDVRKRVQGLGLRV